MERGGHGITSDDRERARAICLRQLTVRPRTRAELAMALRGKGIADAVAAEVLDRFGEVGMVDDVAFAHAWVTTRHTGRGLARGALAGELRRKGVATETVAEAVAELDPATEAATARAIVERRLRVEFRTARRDRLETLPRRLVGVLARKGYSPALAIRVVREALSEHSERVAGRGEGDGRGDALDALDALDGGDEGISDSP